MRRVLLAVAVVLSLAAQDPGLPTGEYCMAGKPEANNPQAHECHCEFICVLDEQGNMVAGEMPHCKAGRCHPKQCVCHTDESCEKPPLLDRSR